MSIQNYWKGMIDLKINEYVQPTCMEEAYNLLLEDKANIIVGGGAWLKLTNKNVNKLINLEQLGLNHIDVIDDDIIIGSMTTLRDVELNEEVKSVDNGILVDAIKGIMGVSIRNIATIGGSIMGRYSFSDILTPLLVMDVELEFYKKGVMSLESFLNEKPFEDILLNIIIHKSSNNGYFYSMKKTSLDFAVVNVAITKGEDIKISVGARPSISILHKEAMKYINGIDKPSEEDIKDVSSMVSSNTKFGTNSRASEEYRRDLVNTYIKRGLREVMKK